MRKIPRTITISEFHLSLISYLNLTRQLKNKTALIMDALGLKLERDIKMLQQCGIVIKVENLQNLFGSIKRVYDDLNLFGFNYNPSELNSNLITRQFNFPPEYVDAVLKLIDYNIYSSFSEVVRIAIIELFDRFFFKKSS